MTCIRHVDGGRSRRQLIGRRLGFAATALFAIGVTMATGGTAAGADDAADGAIASETPVSGLPVILHEGEYQVRAAEVVDGVVLAGGDFQRVENADGDVADSAFFLAADLTTGAIVCPDIRPNGEVRDVIAGRTEGEIYIAGRFSRVSDGRGIHMHSKVSRIDLSTCTVDTEFSMRSVWGQVSDLILVGDELYAGGDFTTINGVGVRHLARINADTGEVDPSFDMDVMSTQPTTIRALGLSTDRDLLILGGKWDTIGGRATGPTAIIDISEPDEPMLTAHGSNVALPTRALTDASVSADGTHIALAFGKATEHDFVVLLDTELSIRSPLWSHYMWDSSFGVAVDRHAVYAGGHFCKIEGGPGEFEVLEPAGVHPGCTGSRDGGDAWRTQLAALSIEDGTPLEWNPGNDAFTGARELTIVDDGLLVGFDGMIAGGVRTGSLAYFRNDATPEEPQQPEIPEEPETPEQPEEPEQPEQPEEPEQPEQPETPEQPEEPEEAEQAEQPETPEQPELPDEPQAPVPAPSCLITEGDGGMILAWTQDLEAKRYHIRRNGAWLADSLSTTLTDPTGTEADEYLVRTRIKGEVSDLVCTRAAADPSY